LYIWEDNIKTDLKETHIYIWKDNIKTDLKETHIYILYIWEDNIKTDLKETQGRFIAITAESGTTFLEGGG
jgi:hypothetical protein